MELKFNVKGKDRKKLAEKVGEFFRKEVSYTGVPRCSYMVGDIEIDKNGTLIINDKHKSKFEELKRALKEQFTLEEGEALDTVSETNVQEPVEEHAREPVQEPPIEEISSDEITVDGYEISLPCD